MSKNPGEPSDEKIFYRTPENSITVEQLNLISHALGLRNFTAHRNHFCSGRQRDHEWDELVSKCYAICRFHGEDRGGYFYHVTDKFLKKLDVKVS